MRSPARLTPDSRASRGTRVHTLLWNYGTRWFSAGARRPAGYFFRETDDERWVAEREGE